ncbi:nucleoside hydrolase [Draconibacterium sp. IB214405]|uniref:nucleoside hydrolase n=1 Tax=Draconibacterium sp. IB214405 TaxID=3097352 RepID=UPI002A121641|nr:nucleoside hydrolase [Draconibacterium sp. IB214405]MDX8338230.1 nucleoside hydrolase [Draconibacterium sp. IB214405]
MFKKIIALLFLSLVFNAVVSAHSGKPKYHVIIDTDGAIDDMRAISMFLAQNDTRVLAITCSQGTLAPDSIFVKVNNLLSAFHHEGIPVGLDKKLETDLPPWAAYTQKIKWASSVSSQLACQKISSVDLISSVFNNYSDKITLVALGSLKTYAELVKAHPEYVDKIERIVWYNNPYIDTDFNESVSPESYTYFKERNIPLEVVGNNTDRYNVDEAYLETIKGSDSKYAKQIAWVHQHPEIVSRMEAEHLQLWDDLVALYLTVPILFQTEKAGGEVSYVTLQNELPDAVVNEAISAILVSGNQTTNRVFNTFPVAADLYKPAYAKMLESTIENYGLIEWKAISMTNEIHGHTGIYSIIGAKMGIRAMEYFNVGVNNLSVTTFAGKKPPLSCFNDGIQISSGATIGQGLITVSDTVLDVPTITALFNKQKIKISVKPEIAAQMQEEIKYGVQTYGLLTEPYWLYIEKLAIRYWSEFDRNQIFTIEKL